mgnify:FL=1
MPTLLSKLDNHVIEMILQYDITFAEYLALCIVEPRIREIDHQSLMIPKLQHFLELRVGKQHKHLIPKLLKVVSENQCMLSGSIIVGLAYDTSWIDADLDIFVPVTKLHTFSPLDRLLQKFRANDPSIEDFTSKKYGQFYRGSDKIVMIRQYEIPVFDNFPLKIQLINVLNSEIGYQNVKEFIKNEFDFDFCKIASW